MASGWIKLTILYVLCYTVYCATLHTEHKRAVDEKDGLPNDVETIDLHMKNAIPDKDDSYICASYEMPLDEVYIVKFEALANASTAHHILLFGCSDGPALDTPTWGCPPLCKSREQIMFAWAKNAPPTVLPKDVGFRVGGASTIRNIVLQIHYAHSSPYPDQSGIRVYITRQKQKYVAGIFLMMSYSITIPAHKPVVHADVSCKYNGNTEMHPFAYRTHAHELGTVITGYQYNNTYHMIGKGNPQWPQAFYPITEKFTVKPGDNMLARCTYNSTQRDTTTYIGPTGKDEMCNFYTMFYTDASVKTTFSQCGGSEYPDLVSHLPPGSDTRLPPNPLLDEMAGHHHHHPQAQTPPPTTGVAIETDLYFDKEWPTGNRLGQVGGVATDKHGNVYIFHRGSRIWEWDSFDAYNVFTKQDATIPEKTILVYDKDGKLIRAFGENLFYMPHGLSIDDQDNVWVTDVALHQAMRFPAGKDKPDLILGEKFKPESDENHFCKPTDIAILSTGEFFISDGYCNGRVMKFSADGKFVKQFGTQDLYATNDGEPPNGAFDIPHSITLAEDKNLVCVADRENGRIQCFDFEGKFSHIIKIPEFGSRLFAIEYAPLHDGMLFAVNGPVFDGVKKVVQGFSVDIKTGKLLQSWNIPQGLNSPHDVAVNHIDHSVYVGEIDKRVWKFIMSHKAGSVPVPEKKEYPALDEKKPDNQNGDKPSSSTPSIVIGVLLVVPVILVIIITILVRMYHTGKFGKKKGNRVFNIQNFFNSHKGFDRLSTEESDHEIDVYDDSDQEEYTAPTKPKM